jgi:hypothetical protein
MLSLIGNGWLSLFDVSSRPCPDIVCVEEAEKGIRIRRRESETSEIRRRKGGMSSRDQHTHLGKADEHDEEEG